MRARQPTSVLVLIAVLAVGGAVTSTFATGTVGPLWAIVPLGAALIVAGTLQVDFSLGRDVRAVDLFEAVLAPILYLFAGPVAVGATAVAKAISQQRLGVAPVKAAFNVAQWSLAAAVASVVYRQLAGGNVGPPPSLVALYVAMLAAVVVNELAMIAVLRLARGVSLLRVLRDLAPGYGASWVVSSVTAAFGLLLAVAVATAPATAPLVLAPLAFLHWGHRAYFALKADHARLDGLHRAADALAVPMDPRDALATFTDEVRAAFASDAVELVLFDEHTVVRSGTAPSGGDDAAHELAAALIATGTVGRLSVETAPDHVAASLIAAGRHDVLVTPVVRGGDTVGALCSYDRAGFEGFEEGEDAVLRALAGALARALEKSDLLTTVVDERRKLSEIVDRSSDGIFTLDRRGRITTWNPAMEAITGYAAGEMVGAPSFAALRPRDGNGEPLWLERWEDGRSRPAELQVVTRAGDDRWLGCSYAVAADGDTLVVVARDITRAREIERLKDDFVATVSHELRTPLTAISGFTTLLLEPGGNPLPEETRVEALSRIRRSSHRLERLVFNLLEVTRIEASRGAPPKTVALDVEDVVARVVDEVEESWPERRIVVHGTGGRTGPKAMGSLLSVERILVNLLSNALTYAHDDPVEVRVTDAGGTDGGVIVTVADHGPGIPEQAQARVFERFERLDTSNQQAGTGLGLYIARKLAENMGATLTLHSRPGEGAAFSLRLPAAGADVVDLTAVRAANAS
jgi:PAS domain S-box-containing protein